MQACNSTRRHENDGSVFSLSRVRLRGQCLVDCDGDGICVAFDGNFDGCMDELACNYQPPADTDNGSWTLAAPAT